MGRTRATVKVEPAPKRWLNKQEAMAYLGVGEDFLQMLRDENHVKFHRFGNRMIWYDLESIDRFVIKNRVN